MAINDIASVESQIQKWWSPMFAKEQRQSNLVVNFLSREYEGQITNGGNRVRVTEWSSVDADLLTIGTDADTFDTKQIGSSYVDLVCDKRCVAAIEVSDVADLQSQLDSESSPIRDSLIYSINKKMNTYLYSLMVPSTTAPDHTLTTTDFNSATVANARLLAATAKWDMMKPWIMTLSPSYYADMLDDTTLSSSLYNGGATPMISGQIGQKRYGFDVFEDNSLATDVGYAFTPDAVLLAVQREPRFKVSDLHPLGKFGVKISLDVVFGAVLGNSGNEKCIKWTAS